jgi:hypothetical protein
MLFLIFASWRFLQFAEGLQLALISSTSHPEREAGEKCSWLCFVICMMMPFSHSLGTTSSSIPRAFDLHDRFFSG